MERIRLVLPVVLLMLVGCTGNHTGDGVLLEDFPTLHIGKRMLVPKDRLIQWIEASTQK